MGFFEKLFGSRRRGGNGGKPREISCEEALRRVHEFIDGELEDVSTAEVQAHFEQCQRCYPHLRLEQAFREAMRRACADEKAPDGLRDRLEKMLAEAAESG